VFIELSVSLFGLYSHFSFKSQYTTCILTRVFCSLRQSIQSDTTSKQQLNRNTVHSAQVSVAINAFIRLKSVATPQSRLHIEFHTSSTHHIQKKIHLSTFDIKMPPKNSKLEIQQSKSPAEFFAENQAIAGFDNPGKSLYTTIRELVENSLDACESVDVLPDISVKIEEMTERMFNALRGVPDDDDADDTNKKNNSSSSKDDKDATENKVDSGKNKKRSKFDAYFQITVRDNGCGMAHKAIPDLLGRVLSGSKYGVRQTRGKFGLGYVILFNFAAAAAAAAALLY
jgi:signal transduction histidine kinase